MAQGNRQKNNYRSPIAVAKGLRVKPSPRANDGVTTTGRGFVISGSGPPSRRQSGGPERMRVAYADPPYPGQAERHYAGHPDYAGEVDHADLIERLESEFPDGWALSTSANALQEVLALCPVKRPGRRRYHDEDSGVRVAVWHVTNAAPFPPLRRWHVWEPVIIRGGRSRCRWSGDLVRDVLGAGNATAGAGDGGLIGAKPPAFCRWLFDLIGLEPDDEFVDLFPGSGVVGREWAAWRNQTRLAV